MLGDAADEIDLKIIEPIYETVAGFAHNDPIDFEIIVGVLLILIIVTITLLCCWIVNRRSESYGLF